MASMSLSGPPSSPFMSTRCPRLKGVKGKEKTGRYFGGERREVACAHCTGRCALGRRHFKDLAM